MIFDQKSQFPFISIIFFAKFDIIFVLFCQNTAIRLFFPLDTTRPKDNLSRFGIFSHFCSLKCQMGNNSKF